MKHFILEVVLFILILSGASYICHSLYVTEQNKYNIATQKDLIRNAASVSAIISYVFNDFISDIEFAAKSVTKYNDGIPTEEDLEDLFTSIIGTKLQVKNICFLDDKGTLKMVYPATYSNRLGNNYAFREYFKKVESANETVVSRVMQNYKAKGTEADMFSFVVITPVFNKKRERTGFILSDIDNTSLAEFLKLDNFIKDDNPISFYLINNEYDQILCAYDGALNSTKISDYLDNDKKVREFLIRSSKTRNTNDSILMDTSGGDYYVTISDVDFKYAPLSIISAIPYTKTINYSADFVRKILLLTVFFMAILIIVIVLVYYQKTMVRKLQKQITNLEIIIDREAVRAETEKVSQSAYFQELNEKIKSLKSDK